MRQWLISLVFLLLALSAGAEIHVTLVEEIQLPRTIDTTARGDYQLVDVDRDGVKDFLFSTDSLFGWYSISDKEMHPVLDKQVAPLLGIDYATGFFDDDSVPDYVEILGDLDLWAIYYLSSHDFSGEDTVLLRDLEVTSFWDPTYSRGYHLLPHAVEDRNQDGIDEIYTGYFLITDECESPPLPCHNRERIYDYCSYQLGDEQVGSDEACGDGIPDFSLATADAAELALRFDVDFGYVPDSGMWQHFTLNLATCVGDDQRAYGKITADRLCLDSVKVSEMYMEGSVVHIRASSILGRSSLNYSPKLLMILYRTHIKFDQSVWTECYAERLELFQFDLNSRFDLTPSWYSPLPSWAKTNLVFADTTTPDKIYLSDGDRLHQVNPRTLISTATSNRVDLGGAMVAYAPLAEGERPLLAMFDDNVLRLFQIDSGIPTAVSEDIALPETFTLAQNYPNPFNPTTEISFTLSHGSQVKLTVYNSLGQVVTELADQFYPAGTHTIEWDGTDSNGHVVASGLYLYRLTTDGYSDSKKMVLMK